MSYLNNIVSGSHEFKESEYQAFEEKYFEQQLSDHPDAFDLSLESESFTTFISHELRTPLTSILGVLRLIHGGHFGSLSAECESFLSLAIVSANRLERLAKVIEHENISPITLLSDLEMTHFHLENDLYLAVDRREFQTAYQPIVCADSNRILGFEALARWQHSQKGWIPPTVFIPLAEKTGLINQIGLRNLERSCFQLSHWQKQFPSASPLFVSVNLSAIQLAQPDFIEAIQKIIQDAGIAPGSLKLEITETSLIQNHDVAIATLTALKVLGVELYVDDFGTGYSSLGRLQDLPVDALKLDRCFIAGKQWHISKAILFLASKLGLDTIAEGVETLEEVEFLKAIGYRKMQGYFFSKPVDGEAASALISTSLDRGITQSKCLDPC